MCDFGNFEAGGTYDVVRQNSKTVWQYSFQEHLLKEEEYRSS
jgi:hypothetical protein